MRYKKNEETALTKIYNASAKLITTTKYSELTNSDIIREANISRSTFYMYLRIRIKFSPTFVMISLTISF